MIGGKRRIVVCDWWEKEDCSVIGGKRRIVVCDWWGKEDCHRLCD